MLPSLHTGRVVICFYKKILCLSPCHIVQTQNRLMSDISRKNLAGSTDFCVEPNKGQSNPLVNSTNKGDSFNNGVEKHGSCTIRNCSIRGVNCENNLKFDKDPLTGVIDCDINVNTDLFQYDSLNNNNVSVSENFWNDSWCCKRPFITKTNFKSDFKGLITSDNCKTSLKIFDTGVSIWNETISRDIFQNTNSCFTEQKQKSFLITNIGSGNSLNSKMGKFHKQFYRHFSKVTALSSLYNHFHSSNGNNTNKMISRNISKKDYEFPNFDEADISEIFQRGDGPGGQATAKTNNCCILTHHPTGIVVRCHETRSLEKNRARAREKLRVQLDVYYNGENSFLALQQKEGIEHRAKKRDRSKKRLEMKKAWKEKNQKENNTETE